MYENNKLTNDEKMAVSAIGQFMMSNILTKAVKKTVKAFPEACPIEAIEYILHDLQKNPKNYFTDRLIDSVMDRFTNKQIDSIFYEFDSNFTAITCNVYFTPIAINFNMSREDLVDYFGERGLTRQDAQTVANTLHEKFMLAKSMSRKYVMPTIKLDEIDIDNIATRDSVTIFTKYRLYIDESLTTRDNSLPNGKWITYTTNTLNEILELLPSYNYYESISDKIYDMRDYYESIDDDNAFMKSTTKENVLVSEHSDTNIDSSDEFTSNEAVQEFSKIGACLYDDMYHAAMDYEPDPNREEDADLDY